MGRPSLYSPELGQRIADEMVGGKSLRAICREDWTPTVQTVCNWIARGKEHPFFEQYEHAREARAELLADEIVELADTPKEGVRIRESEKGTEVVRGDMIERAKLQVDARKWVAARLLPKRYGERTAITDPDGNAPTFRLVIEHVGKGTQSQASAEAE